MQCQRSSDLGETWSACILSSVVLVWRRSRASTTSGGKKDDAASAGDGRSDACLAGYYSPALTASEPKRRLGAPTLERGIVFVILEAISCTRPQSAHSPARA